MMEELQKLDVTIFVGGDLAFLDSLYGMSNASSYPCIWCTFHAKKTRKIASEVELLDDMDYSLRNLAHFDNLIQSTSKKKDDLLGVTKKYIWPVEPSQVI